ncbi:hypothetical protein V493_01478 [Pseudogymnoascus sp. VKM F-4281 (FW-2241)]|nr:hypothetical protein V493_01478 [Pseudogymnoascus sp. VKM F-4281 (FW-2241)]
MNPYTSNPDDIPATDNKYADLPLYGRLSPILASVVKLCNESVRIYPADKGGRDVFALGSVIKSSHLHELSNGHFEEIDLSYADANEDQAIAIAKNILKDVSVPDIFFAGKVNGRQVLVQERLPGVGSNVAWQYLSQNQKESFKQQSRKILRQLHTVKPADGRQTRSHVVLDPNVLSNGHLAFMHNDFTECNCIVENDRVVGVIDWEMAGFFGWKTAGEVHRRLRTPQREHFASLNLSEARLQEFIHWNDLYDDGAPELIALGSSAENQERHITINSDSLQKARANGCLSCSLIQGIVQARGTRESNFKTAQVYVNKDGCLYVSATYISTIDGIGTYEKLYPFTVREKTWDVIPMMPVDNFTTPDPPTLESAVPLIQTWIQRCDLDHSCYKHSLGIPTQLPTRVIDVGDSSHDPYLYITHGETGRFIALSHCWGPPEMPFTRLTTTQTNLSAHCQRITIEKLPRTFRDAINVTRDLGLRYIWIDSLCIIQDSTEDWILEVSRMADIYRNAYITLAADRASHSDAGLFITDSCATNSGAQIPQFSQLDNTGTSHQIFITRDWRILEKNQRQGDAGKRPLCHVSEAVSKLSSRAWVLQESILSPRTVHFTNAELVWECSDLNECSCGTPMLRNSRKSLFKAALQHPTTTRAYSRETLHPATSIWHSVVEESTARDLTYATDRLPALSSLAMMLPFPKGDYLAGLWQNSLMDDLLWLNPIGDVSWELDNNSDTSTRLDTLPPLKNYRIQGEYAPSWSWASVSAPVAFNIESSRDITPEWRVTGARCMPITANPFGPVSKSSSLHVEGCLLPVTFSKVMASESTVDQNGNYQRSVKFCAVCGDNSFSGRNTTWFDAGIGGQEWQVEGYAYYALVIGCRIADNIPVALLLRGRGGVGEEVYTRIGLVSFDSWEGHEWSIGTQKRAITIF